MGTVGGKRLLALVTMLCIPGLSGCGLFLLGRMAYESGEQAQVQVAPYDRVWSATLAALGQMDIHVVKAEKDQKEGKIEARRADDTGVTIQEKPVGPDTTRVKVRVAELGNKDAEQIQVAITRNLQSTP